MTNAPDSPGALADAATRVFGEEHIATTNIKGLVAIVPRRFNASGIEPLDLKVLIRPKPSEEKTAGGIIIPDAVADKQKYAVTEGTVVGVGDNAFEEWLKGKDPSQVITPQIGDRILHAQYAGARVKGADGEDYILMNDEDLVAVLREEQ